MTTTLPEVLALLDKATPGELSVYDENEGDGWPPRQLWCIKNADYDSGSEDAIPFQATIYYGGKEDAEAIAASVNLLRTHGDTLQCALALLAAVESGDAFGTWQPIETAPKDGVTPILVYGEGESYIALRPIDCPDDAAATMFGHSACYPTHWMPLPPPPGTGLSHPLPPGTKKCWCATCWPITTLDFRFIVCPDCGNKRCPKATNHVNACTGSNEPGQPGSAWENVKPGTGVECPHLTRCDCLGACKYGFAGNGAATGTGVGS